MVINVGDIVIWKLDKQKLLGRVTKIQNDPNLYAEVIFNTKRYQSVYTPVSNLELWI